MTITNLPSSLSGESFQCVFGGFGSGKLTTVGGDMFSCSVPNIPSFVGKVSRIAVCLQSVFNVQYIAICTYIGIGTMGAS